MTMHAYAHLHLPVGAHGTSSSTIKAAIFLGASATIGSPTSTFSARGVARSTRPKWPAMRAYGLWIPKRRTFTCAVPELARWSRCSPATLSPDRPLPCPAPTTSPGWACEPCRPAMSHVLWTLHNSRAQRTSFLSQTCNTLYWLAPRFVGLHASWLASCSCRSVFTTAVRTSASISRADTPRGRSATGISGRPPNRASDAACLWDSGLSKQGLRQCLHFNSGLGPTNIEWPVLHLLSARIHGATS